MVKQALHGIMQKVYARTIPLEQYIDFSKRQGLLSGRIADTPLSLDRKSIPEDGYAICQIHSHLNRGTKSHIVEGYVR